MSARLTVTEATVPTLPRHVKLRHDEARERWIMQAPERVLVPDETALEIVRLCDGEVSIGDVVLVKGSRGGGVRPAMRVIIDALRARDGEPSPRAAGNG